MEKGRYFVYRPFFVYVEVDTRMEYRTIAAPVSASFVEKKSEFIAQLFRYARRKMLWKPLKMSANNTAERGTMSTLICCGKVTLPAILTTANRRALPACRFWTCC